MITLRDNEGVTESDWAREVMLVFISIHPADEAADRTGAGDFLTVTGIREKAG